MSAPQQRSSWKKTQATTRALAVISWPRRQRHRPPRKKRHVGPNENLKILRQRHGSLGKSGPRDARERRQTLCLRRGSSHPARTGASQGQTWRGPPGAPPTSLGGATRVPRCGGAGRRCASPASCCPRGAPARGPRWRPAPVGTGRGREQPRGPAWPPRDGGGGAAPGPAPTFPSSW